MHSRLVLVFAGTVLLVCTLLAPAFAQVIVVDPTEGGEGSNLCIPTPDGGVRVTTSRIQVVFREGQIDYVKNLVTGEVETFEATQNNPTPPSKIPRGMGHLTPSENPTHPGLGRDPGREAGWHAQLGAYYAPGNAPRTDYPWYHRPHVASGLAIMDAGTSSCTIKWIGLTNGDTMFPNEQELLDVQLGPAGELEFSARVQSDTLGVFGASVPIVNLTTTHRLYLPAYGGIVYDSLEQEDGQSHGEILRTFDRLQYWEAPVAAVESDTGSLGLWIADPDFIPNSFMFHWNATTFGIGMPQYNLMPFEGYPSFNGTWWHLDAFAGNWIEAMTPYRDWYADRFADQLGVRESFAWANTIRVISDQWTRWETWSSGWQNFNPDDVYTYMQQNFPADTVLLYESHARASAFDSNLPNYTPATFVRPPHNPPLPDSTLADRNDHLHTYGLRTMGYVNSFVVNYGSPAFCSENVFNTGVPRRYMSFWDYRLANDCSDNPLVEPCAPFDWDDAVPADPPAACIPSGHRAPTTDVHRQHVYLDPVSAAWRADHQQKMHDWITATHFDANYEDVAGFVGDFGNGIVGGLNGSTAAIKMFSDLQSPAPPDGLATVHVPMAAEYGGNAAIALSTIWPARNYYRFDILDAMWLSHHNRPVSSFLFGQTAWVTTFDARDNAKFHAITNMADALGGLGNYRSDPFSYNATRGDLGHMFFRSKQFALRQLKPFFDTAHGPAHLVSSYVDNLNNRFDYFDDGTEQKLVGPQGAQLYSRITGVNAKTSDLVLPNWPMTNYYETGWQVGGLEPTAHYALEAGTPGSSNVGVESVQGDPTGCGAGSESTKPLRITKYYETPTHVVLVVDKLNGASGISAPTTANVSLRTRVRCYKAIVNGVVGSAPTWVLGSSGPSALAEYCGVTLPATFVFTKVATPPTYATGVQFGTPAPGHFIEKETGIDRGGERDTMLSIAYPWGAPPGHSGSGACPPPATNPGKCPTTVLQALWGENAMYTLDYLVKVPNNANSVIIPHCGTGGISDAVFYVDGQEVWRECSVATNRPECDYGGLANQCVFLPVENYTSSQFYSNYRTFSFPVTQYRGKEILISVAMDDGPDNFPDGDGRYFAIPRFSTTVAGQ
jgi:hypothetical protein